MLESVPKDLNRPWEDPLPEAGERHLAAELRGVGNGGLEMPEWKMQACRRPPPPPPPPCEVCARCSLPVSTL